MTRFTNTMAVEVNWNAMCRLATLRTRDPGRMVDQSTMPVAMTPTAAMRAPSITQVAATGASRKCPILETTSRPRAVVYRAMGKWTVAGWVGCPIGFPWMISLSVQDMVPPVAVRRLWRQHTPGRRPQARLLEPFGVSGGERSGGRQGREAGTQRELQAEPLRQDSQQFVVGGRRAAVRPRF